MKNTKKKKKTLDGPRIFDDAVGRVVGGWGVGKREGLVL